MPLLAEEIVSASGRLGTATCVAGGTIQQLLRASTHKSVPQGDLLLAATLSARVGAPHFSVTKRQHAQRRELIRQPQDARPYMQQAAALQGAAQRARSASVLADVAEVPRATVVHNVRDSAASRCADAPAGGAPAAAPVAAAPGGGNWFFNLALQSSML